MLATNVGLVLGGSILLARFRETLSDHEERLSVQSWQLQQLVPEQARGSSAPPSPESEARLPDDGPESS